jgi:hypothetical protein
VNSKLTAELGRKGTEAPRKVRDCVLQLLQSDRVQNGNCMSRTNPAREEETHRYAGVRDESELRGRGGRLVSKVNIPVHTYYIHCCLVMGVY